MEYNSCVHNKIRFNIILQFIYVFYERSSSQVFPPKSSKHLSCLPHVPHAPPISFFLIWPPK